MFNNNQRDELKLALAIAVANDVIDIETANSIFCAIDKQALGLTDTGMKRIYMAYKSITGYNGVK